MQYWDANNLYVWAMSQLLQYKDIEFSDIDLETVLRTADDNEECCILELYLHVPEEFHDKSKEFPPRPEIMPHDQNLFSDH